MYKRGFLFPLMLTVLLLAGCASSVNDRSAGAKKLEDDRMPTDVPDTVSLTETARTESAAAIPPADCPVTIVQDPQFTPPPPYSDLGFEGYFWYGSNSLWTTVPDTGIWTDLPHDLHGYTQKLPWWRAGYVWNEEPEPDLRLMGERLDAPAPPLTASEASNAYAADIGSAMMVGMKIPTPGCWKITGTYNDAELSFVVWVAP
jgi:hypothetical protein